MPKLKQELNQVLTENAPETESTANFLFYRKIYYFFPVDYKSMPHYVSYIWSGTKIQFQS